MKKYALVFIGIALLFGCAPSRPDQADKGISVSNQNTLVQMNDTITLYQESTRSWFDMRRNNEKAKKVDKFIDADENEYSLIRVAHIPPISIEGKTVQANDILIEGNKAYIAYNYAGDDCVGAIQIVDIGTSDKPAILEEVKFANMDVNVLYFQGNTVLFGGQTDPEIWGFKSYIAALNPNEILIDDIIASVKGLSSHATSGIARHGNNYYVGVGAQNGELEILNSNLDNEDTLLIDDIRDVEPYQSGVILVAGTTDNANQNGAVIIVKQNQIHSPKKIPISNFNSSYHKATIEVYEGTIALLGLSAAGFSVLDLTSESIIYSCSNPVSIQGAASNTNSVSSDGKLIFTANGGYGFRVLRSQNKKFESIDVVGFYHPGVESDVDIGYSANHVKFKSNYLFVAGGASGVHIYSLKNKTR